MVSNKEERPKNHILLFPQRTALHKVLAPTPWGPADSRGRQKCCRQSDWGGKKRATRVPLQGQRGSNFLWTSIHKGCDDPTGNSQPTDQQDRWPDSQKAYRWLKFKLLPHRAWPYHGLSAVFTFFSPFTFWTYVYSVLQEVHLPGPTWTRLLHSTTPFSHPLGKLRWPN